MKTSRSSTLMNYTLKVLYFPLAFVAIFGVPSSIGSFHDNVDVTTELVDLSSKTNTESTNKYHLDPWLMEVVKDVAYYLRSHKFNEFDRRFYRKENDAQHNLFKEFPVPPLRTLHWEVRRNCISSFIDCIHYIQRTARKASLRREDDTAVVVLQQNWTVASRTNNEELNTAEKQCRRFYDADQKTGTPFESLLERFRWRTTTSYFMCWYTMLREPALEIIGERCDNYASCLDPTYGPYNSDFRLVDSEEIERPYACAQYSFCPDPCCPGKHYSSEIECFGDDMNPCRSANGETTENDPKNKCEMRPERNTDFDGITLNLWNVTCNCTSATDYYRRLTEPDASSFPNYRDDDQGYASVVIIKEGGFVWNSRFGMCVDVDECSTGTDNCDREKEACHNLPGGYSCSCSFGYVSNISYQAQMFPERGKLDLQCLRDKRLKAANDIVAAIRGIKLEDGVVVQNGFFGSILRTFGIVPSQESSVSPEQIYTTGGAGHYLVKIVVVSLFILTAN